MGEYDDSGQRPPSLNKPIEIIGIGRGKNRKEGNGPQGRLIGKKAQKMK